MRLMAKARIEHIINCSAETFWNRIFFDEEFNRRLFLETLGFESYEQASFDETDREIRRVVDAVPQVQDLPGPLKKFAESGLGYREKLAFDKSAQRGKVEVEPQSLKGKLHIRGELYTEPAGEGRCKRVYDATVEAKVFGVGGMIEKRILGDIQDSYGKAAEFTNRYIAEKGL